MGFRMIGIDVGEKEKLSKDCGAEVFIDITKFSRDKEGTAKLAEEVKKATGGPGAAAVVICTASNAAYGQGLDFLKFNGTMVAVGVSMPGDHILPSDSLTNSVQIPEGDVQPIANADPVKFIVQQLNVVGSAVGNRVEVIETMNMAARGIVKTHFKVEKTDRLNDVFYAMDQGKLQGRVVLDLSG
jgi:alcohol dehydrogenase, propanol-preferring